MLCRSIRLEAVSRLYQYCWTNRLASSSHVDMFSALRLTNHIKAGPLRLSWKVRMIHFLCAICSSIFTDLETEVDDGVPSAIVFLELQHLELRRPGDTREEAKVFVADPAILPLALDRLHHFFHLPETTLMFSWGYDTLQS